MAAPRHIRRALLRHARPLHRRLSMLATVLFLSVGATGFMLNHPGRFGLDDARSTEATATVPAAAIAARDKLAVVEILRGRVATGAVQPFERPGDREPFHIALESPRGQCDADIALPGGETQLTV